MGFYYLNDRYYDSNIGRFLTADDPSYLGANGDLLSYNLYAYCSNNPVMYVDPTGHFITAALIGSIVAGFLIGIGSKYLPDVINKIDENGFQWNDLIEPWEENWMEYTISGLSGAVVGASFGLGLGFGAAAYQAGMVISTGTALTTLAGVTIGSFAAGVGIYALETKVFNLCEYDYGEMWQAGLHMGIRGVKWDY